LSNYRIPLVGFLEQALANFVGVDRGDDLELALVFQEFCESLDDFVVGIRDSQLVNLGFEVAFRLIEMTIEQLDEFLCRLTMASISRIDEQRPDFLVSRA
jgi:hypothetical protein